VSRQRVLDSPVENIIFRHEEVISIVAHVGDESAKAPDVGGERVALELGENLWCHVSGSS
jgi:hypothetical protein